MDPVVALRITYASVQRVRRQHQYEVGRLSDADQKIFVEPADTKALDVDVDAEAVKSEVDFQQTATNNTTRNNRIGSRLKDKVLTT